MPRALHGCLQMIVVIDMERQESGLGFSLSELDFSPLKLWKTMILSAKG